MTLVKKLPKISPWGVFLWGVISLSPLWAYAAQHWLGLGMVFANLSAGLWVIIGAPLVEEAVFRYLLQGGLNHLLMTQPRPGMSPLWAGHASNVLVSLVFACAHPPAHAWLFHLWWLLPSLVLGELWRQYQNYVRCAAVHAWFNLCLWSVT